MKLNDLHTGKTERKPRLSENELAVVEAVAAHRRRHIKVNLITATSTTLATALTTKGLYEKEIEAGVADAIGMGFATMSAAGAAVLVGGATILLLGTAANAAKSQFRKVVALGVCLAPFILCINTYYAMLATAGAPSLVYDMRDSAIAHAEYFEQAIADSSKAQSAEATLLPLQYSICGLAGDEKSGGILTGSAGQGAVYAAYASGCKSIGTIVQTLTETGERTNSRREEAAQILAELKSIPKDMSLTVFERQAAFREKVGALRNLIGDSGAEKVAQRLMAQLKILESSVATLGVEEGEFGQRQESAVRNLKSALTQVAATVKELVGNGDAVSLQPPAELLEMGEAVFRYWKRNIPQILFAVLVDCMSLWFFALLMVSRGTAEAYRQEMLRAPATKLKINTRKRSAKK